MPPTEPTDDELRRLGREADGLPWTDGGGLIVTAEDWRFIGEIRGRLSTATTAYIVAACNAVPSLLDRLDAMARAVELLRRAQEYVPHSSRSAQMNVALWREIEDALCALDVLQRDGVDGDGEGPTRPGEKGA